MATWVKICGIMRREDARAALDSGADAIGINFWSPGRRYCEPAQARDIVAGLPAGTLVFGVFVDAPRDAIEAIVCQVGLTGIQLHGSEPPGASQGWSLPVIRAVPATSRAALVAAMEAADRYARGRNGAAGRAKTGTFPEVSGYRVLVDHATGGGSGKVVDAALLDGVDLGQAILAGGLTPQNVAASVARFRPFGVDAAGGVESAPGVKDARKIAAFVREARSAALPS